MLFSPGRGLESWDSMRPIAESHGDAENVASPHPHPGVRMQRYAMFAALTLLSAPPLQAQHLRDELSDLFIFGAGQSPLNLGGTSDPSNPDSIRIHGNHFVPAAVASNGTVISFLTNSIGSNASNVPVSAASGGSTFSFEGGVPIRTS